MKNRVVETGVGVHFAAGALNAASDFSDAVFSSSLENKVLNKVTNSFLTLFFVSATGFNPHLDGHDRGFVGLHEQNFHLIF